MFRFIAIVLFLALAGAANGQSKPRVLVFAAASMKNVLDMLGAEFAKTCECSLVLSLASSGTLARQIEAGAPADVFISADLEWMEWLANKEIIEADAQKVIAKNRLIVVLSVDEEKMPSGNVADLLSVGRIAIANPTSVPAGRYARQALQKLGLWEKVSSRLVLGENVRISLSLAARGDVKTAIVYQSDLVIEPRVKLAYMFSEDSHQPIVYPAALIGRNTKAEEFLKFLGSSKAIAIFQKFGFTAVRDD
ncbi:MAG: molybdate ABC transporter substrate-binding protein [Rhizobiaceae bacterium]|nr:molybdate ABC transporter substrate-binding protein [Rhizobiaceae bacterium]